jgi:hypothetical protein
MRDLYTGCTGCVILLDTGDVGSAIFNPARIQLCNNTGRHVHICGMHLGGVGLWG